MKIIIDTEKCLQEHCSRDETLLLLALYFKSFDENVIRQAILDDFLTLHSNCMTTDCTKFVITRKGVDKVESIMLNSEIVDKTESNKDRYVVLAEKLRELYPTGKKPGTNLQWRDSVPVIATRLKALVKKYGVEFTDEEAVEATRNYINSFNGMYTYMHVLKYFILKNNINDRTDDTSELLSGIANLGSEDITFNNDNGELV